MGNVIAKHNSPIQPRQRITRVSGAFGNALETTLATEGGDAVPVAVRFLVDAIEQSCMSRRVFTLCRSIGFSGDFSGSC